MRQIEIEWLPLDIRITVDLDDAKNRRLNDLLWSKLPYRSLQNHALVSGNHLYHLLPFPEFVYTAAETRVPDRTKEPDGTVFLSRLQHLAIKYGPLSEYLPAAPVGTVRPADMDALREVGRGCWEAAYHTKQPIEVRVTRKGDSTPIPGLPRPAPVADPAVQRLINEIHDETVRVWIEPPTELMSIHEGEIKSGAGSYDQYLSTMVFVNGETRPLGYCALNGLINLWASGEHSLETLRAITPTFVSTPAEFLGYCGLDNLWRFTRQALDSLPQVQTREEYFSLVSTLSLYANCLNTWNLHLFPWELGDRFRHPRAL
ncbi:hypothetical protein ACFY3U_27275 [Micromonospora sp. NPDC000089]|uniref:cucumopine synthase-related protein n=1 Tax=unclassified Micromonospora TaxID=2617518 RepID=UPI0036ABFCC2